MSKVITKTGSYGYEEHSRRHSTVKEYEKENIIDSQLEYLDPTPSLPALFVNFNKRFFWGALDVVEVRWSKRMTTCAGLCTYKGRKGGCIISLSAPLLSLRPRKDLVETLLHEMIHAYLFVTHNNKDRDGHGPEFHKHMRRINQETGTNITVFHNFHDEVRYCQPYAWRCNGPCRSKYPFYGVVRRAMNRAPGPSDRWWAEHQFTCGGEFLKVEGKSKDKPKDKPKDKSKPTAPVDPEQKLPTLRDIRSFFIPSRTSTPNSSIDTPVVPVLVPLGIPVAEPPRRNSVVKPPRRIPAVEPPRHLPVVEPPRHLPVVEPPRRLPVVEPPRHLPVVEPPRRNSLVKPPLSLPVVEPPRSLPVVEPPRRLPVVEPPRRLIPVHEPRSFHIPTPPAPRKVLPRKRPSSVPPSCSGTSGDNGAKKPAVSPTDVAATVREVWTARFMPKCPVCSKCFTEQELNGHLDECLADCPEVVEEVPRGKEHVGCPVCGCQVPAGELSDHLEACLNCTFDNLDPEDDLEEPGTEGPPQDTPQDLPESTQATCPCCMALVPQDSINRHIDECLTKIALQEGLLDDI